MEVGGGSDNNMEARDERYNAAWHVSNINEILRTCGFNESITSLSQCSVSMFVCVFESLFNTRMTDIKRYPKTKEDHLFNCMALLDVLETKVLHILFVS